MEIVDPFLRYAVVINGQKIAVISDPDHNLGRHIGNGIWTSAEELACFICVKADLIQRRRVLELGAGLGLVGQVSRLFS